MLDGQSQQAFAFGKEDEPGSCLAQWPPDLQALDEGWRPLLEDFLASATGAALSKRLNQALSERKVIYPPEPLRALALTPLKQVRVVILGQDPYHGPGQAEGLAFSVQPGVKVPPSLRNIFKELQQSLGVPIARDGSLVRWAQQGVLLLNTCLTVEAGQAASHARWGWEALTDALLKAAAQNTQPLVFMLWGAHAQEKKQLIDGLIEGGQHLVLSAHHPSPLSANRPPTPFLGCNHFAMTNDFLGSMGGKTIIW
ncbi:uracil-DNA glycosylase [Limnohabitans sp. 2KL-3]|uniref:uracil-DNA glycosylase n=1 Tax=Limnohabitans sp. 2KL-3 TaxID=1100700 RepID=UPI000AD0956F|nr:uracil-DNA glycosylase [Limnohabitans sp. 2KL-3]